MAMQETSPATAPSAQVVGNAFVEQYYHILHQSPESVYRFYQDSSMLSRADPNGIMTTVTTMQAINDKILSFNYKDYKAEIETADAQESYKGGVIVIVTGCLTGKDNVKRKFTQTFFLAPQDKGYFVLNDISRYVDDNITWHNTTGNAPITTLPADTESGHVSHPRVLETATSIEIENSNNEDQASDHLNNEERSDIELEEEVTVELPIQSNPDEVHSVVDSVPIAQEETSKKSYASIVKVKGNTAAGPVYVPTSIVRAVPANTEQQSASSAKSSSVPEAAAPKSDNAPENSNVHVEVQGHSIYIKNLPLTATAAQLHEVFKRFGPIKQGGVQVRSTKQLGICFGFVEFEMLSSMQSALKASPITIGDRQAVVEIKRNTNRVGSSGRGMYPPGRGGFRGESFRGRGNYDGGRSYGRNDFRNQGEFTGRRRGTNVRNWQNYQRVSENGGGRGGQGVG